MTDDKCSPAEYKSRREHRRHPLQTTETWIYERTTTPDKTTTNTAVATGEDRTGDG